MNQPSYRKVPFSHSYPVIYIGTDHSAMAVCVHMDRYNSITGKVPVHFYETDTRVEMQMRPLDPKRVVGVAFFILGQNEPIFQMRYGQNGYIETVLWRLMPDGQTLVKPAPQSTYQTGVVYGGQPAYPTQPTRAALQRPTALYKQPSGLSVKGVIKTVALFLMLLVLSVLEPTVFGETFMLANYAGYPGYRLFRNIFSNEQNRKEVLTIVGQIVRWLRPA